MSLRIKPFITLCRVSNLPTVWTNVLTAALLSGSHCCTRPFLTVMISMSLLYSAGMCLNDIVDEQYDRARRSNRPLPTGTVSGKEARLLTLILFAGGVLLLFAAPFHRAMVPGAVLIATIVWYDIIHKKFRGSIMLMAACRSLVFITTAAALAGHASPPVLIASSVHFFYILSVTAIARFENSRHSPFTIPIIPLMLAGISLVDGILLLFFPGSWWSSVGPIGFLLTIAAQRFVRGD